MSLRVLEIARGEIGYLEKATNANLDSKTANAGDMNFTKYARDLDSLGVYHAKKQGLSWCAMFCLWCFVKAYGVLPAMRMTGQQMAGYGAGCTESARYYKSLGRFFTSNPQPGDQIFFTRDGGKTMYHTGLVERVANGRVYTIEGNTSSAPGVEPNGGSVWDKSYSLTYAQIGGYGRPDYSIVEDDMITLDEFKELMKEYRKELQDNDSSNYSEAAREWAVATGIVEGNSHEEFNGMWEDFMTREQFVTVLYRFYRLLEAQDGANW